MSLHLLGAQISTTLWRSKIEDMTGDVLCLKSGSKGIFTVCRSAVSFLCSAVSKLSKDFASGLCLHRSKTLRLRVQNVHSKELWCCLLPLVSISTTQQLRISGFKRATRSYYVAVSTNTSKIASRLLPLFSNLFETTRAICRGFWAIKCNFHTYPNGGRTVRCLCLCRGFKTSALLWTNPLTKYFLFLLDQKLLECSSCLTLESL